MKQNTWIWLAVAALGVYYFFFRGNNSSSANPFPGYGGTTLPQLTLPKGTGGLGNTSSHVSPVSPSGASIGGNPLNGINSAANGLSNLIKTISGLFKGSPDTGTGNSDATGGQGYTSAIDPFGLSNIGEAPGANGFGAYPNLPVDNQVGIGSGFQNESPFMVSDFNAPYASNFDVGGYGVPSLTNDQIVTPNSDSWGAAYSSAFDSTPIDPSSQSTPIGNTFSDINSFTDPNTGTNFTWNGSSFDASTADPNANGWQ